MTFTFSFVMNMTWKMITKGARFILPPNESILHLQGRQRKMRDCDASYEQKSKIVHISAFILLLLLFRIVVGYLLP